MRLFIFNNYHFEWHRNLKYWGENIEYVKSDTIVPYFRCYALFIFFNNPNFVID